MANSEKHHKNTDVYSYRWGAWTSSPNSTNTHSSRSHSSMPSFFRTSIRSQFQIYTCSVSGPRSLLLQSSSGSVQTHSTCVTAHQSAVCSLMYKYTQQKKAVTTSHTAVYSLWALCIFLTHLLSFNHCSCSIPPDKTSNHRLFPPDVHRHILIKCYLYFVGTFYSTNSKKVI